MGVHPISESSMIQMLELLSNKRLWPAMLLEAELTCSHSSWSDFSSDICCPGVSLSYSTDWSLVDVSSTTHGELGQGCIPAETHLAETPP